MRWRIPTIVLLLSVICIAGGTGPGGIGRLRDVPEKRDDGPETSSLSRSLTHFLMGAVYDNFGETARAVEEYRKALEEKPDVPEIRMKLGSDLLLLGRHDEAKEVLEAILEDDPEDIRGLLFLAIIHTVNKEFQEAEAYYRKALELEPENLRALSFLSDLFILDRRLDKAAEIYERMAEISQDEEFIHFNLGLIYVRMELFDKAELNLKKAVDIDGEYIEAHMLLGFLYEMDGREQEAIDRYNKVIDLDGMNREARLRLAHLYYRGGMTLRAIEENRALIKIDSSLPGPYMRIFTLHLVRNELDKAEEILEEAVSGGISSGEVYAGLGYVSGIQGFYGKAAEYYRLAGENEPENRMYRFYLAVSLDNDGRREEAARELEKLVSGPEEAPAQVYNYLGYLYVEEEKELDRAVELIQKAIAMDPENGAYIDSLGWAYYKKGLYEEALREVERAAEYMPDNPVIRDHLGDIYHAKGKIEKALAQWELSLGLDPSNKEVEEKIERARERIGYPRTRKIKMESDG